VGRQDEDGHNLYIVRLQKYAKRKENPITAGLFLGN